MTPITATDLSAAARAAALLTQAIDQPFVLAGALAMAAHGYRRETHDVDIVIPVVIGGVTGDIVENAAKNMGLAVRAKHGFGGLDLREGDVRIDVLTLDRDMPALIPAAVADAIHQNRQVTLFGQRAFVVSLGYLIAMKLVAERKKDIADIVELIKVRMGMGEWIADQTEVATVVRTHLGWYAARRVGELATIARAEIDSQ